MGVSKKEVFLVQGEYPPEGGQESNGAVAQLVIVARDSEDMLAVLKTQAPKLRVIGFATLEAYAATAAKLRAALKGEPTDWPVFIAPSMAK